MQKTNHITIRGTKEGLILILDDECSFSELVSELEEKLSSKYSLTSEGPSVQVKVSVGNRYLTEVQTNQLEAIINDKQKLIVNQIESNVLTRTEAENLKKESEVSTVVKVVRSGQVLTVTGDLLLLGDVNPGGTIVATGNIYVIGVLRGIAHAGSKGNKKAIISASKMEPSQLRISDIVSRSPDKLDKTEIHQMECAFIGDDNKIAIEKVQNLTKIRPNLTNI